MNVDFSTARPCTPCVCRAACLDESDAQGTSNASGAGQSHGRNLRTLLQLGDGACVLLRLGGLWPGLRGLAIKLPLIAFPAGVNAEGVMVFVNARSTRGGATERQVIEVHPPAAVPRIQRRVRCKAQVLQLRLGFVEPASRKAGPGPPWAGAGGGLCGSEGKGLGLGAALWNHLWLSRQGIVWQVWSVGPLRT